MYLQRIGGVPVDGREDDGVDEVGRSEAEQYVEDGGAETQPAASTAAAAAAAVAERCRCHRVHC